MQNDVRMSFNPAMNTEYIAIEMRCSLLGMLLYVAFGKSPQAADAEFLHCLFFRF